MIDEERKRVKEVVISVGVGMCRERFGEEVVVQFGIVFVDYIYEQLLEELFCLLLPKYVSIQIFRVLLESVAVEHAVCMIVMDSVISNVIDMIDSLTLMMN